MPLYLPVLHLVTLATVPATALYAVMGLLSSPIVIPLIILAKFIHFLLFAPLMLLTLPVALPVGGLLALICTVKDILCSLFTVFTPFLWPLCFLYKWCCFTFVVSQVVIKDTIMPWLVPIRFTFLAALLPAGLLH